MATTQDDHDHHHFEGRSEAVLVVTIILTVLASIFVLLRIIARGLIVKHVTSDDWIMLLAWIIAIGLSFTICYGTTWGLGRHEENVPASWQSTLRKTDYSFSVLYFAALTATKDSILAFYLTLAKMNRVFQWACWGTLFAVNAGGLALIFVSIFQCDPVRASFEEPPPPSAKCTDILTIYLASVPLNLITDFAILFLPMPVLTRMRLPMKQKVILIVTFSFGVFVAAVDVIRLSYLQSAASTRLAEIQTLHSGGSGYQRGADEVDSSFYLSFSYMWSAVEVDIGIMCACVPGLKPLATRFFPGLVRSIDDPSSAFGSFSKPVPMIEEDKATSDPMPQHPQDSNSASEPQEDDGPMGMMDFLTTPDMHDLPSHPIERSPTALTNTSRHTRPTTPTFFDFVDMRQRKSLVQMTNRECIFPIAVVTLLFFVWGFEYGLLNELNKEFQDVAKITPGQSTAIHSAYYAGYFVAPLLVGWPVLRNWGFKMCFPIGLCIYASGLLIFWPAAVLTSWPTFIVSNFIAGFGLSILEVAANPWIVLCGPPEYGEIRLNLSQGVQAIGSVIAPLIADKAFFGKSNNAPSLVATQWAYLGISLATTALAVAYYYIPLPEATDAELEEAAERIDGANEVKIGKYRFIWFALAFGVFSQFCYVGGQEVNGTMFGDYLSAVAPSYNVPNYLAIAHTAFAVSRFLAAGLGFWIKPRILMLGFYCGGIIFQVLAMNYTGGTGVAMIIMVFFMEGPLFSLIFAQALRGMGRHTKLASVFITAAISGGSVFSPISSHITHDTNRGAAYALVVAVAAFAAGSMYAVGLNASPVARRLVDPVRSAGAVSRPSSMSSRASRRLTFGIIGKKSNHSGPVAGVAVRQRPTAEHEA